MKRTLSSWLATARCLAVVVLVSVLSRDLDLPSQTGLPETSARANVSHCAATCTGKPRACMTKAGPIRI